MKSLCYLLVAACLCFAGCNRAAQPETKTEPTAEQNAAKVAADDAKFADTDDAAQEKAQNPAVFVADFGSDAVPELHTHETVVSEAAWGKMKRTTVEWAGDIEVYHEIPVFDGEDAAIAAVNAKMREIHSGFLSAENLKSAWEYEYARYKSVGGESPDDKYTYTYRAEVKEFSEKYVSVTFDMAWYMGGVLDYGTSAYVFDRATGKALRLGEVYQKDDEAVRAMVAGAVHAYADENVDPGLMEWGALDKMKDYSFYMVNGVPHVVFKKYEIAAGAAGAFDIELPKP